MKILVCGGRDWYDMKLIREHLSKYEKPITVIHGAARGADSLAGYVATALGFDVMVFPADWDEYGKAAGMIRNKQMLSAAPDLVLAFHDDIEHSKGTKNMVALAQASNVPTEIITH